MDPVVEVATCAAPTDVDGLFRRKYKTIEAVRGVSFTIGRGELFACWPERRR